MNHFQFYNIPISFQVDAAAIKKIFIANSKKYHPDFYALESDAKQAEILDLSTQNNEAYKVLSDFNKRMEYILKLKGAMGIEGQNKLPQDFLIEMMDINEQLMEMEFDFDAEVYNNTKIEIEQIDNKLFSDVEDILKTYNGTEVKVGDLEKVKIFYLKKKYLLRILENVSKFAPH
jgi:molecular chaperone HscB